MTARASAFIILVLCSTALFAQDYPKNYFRNPLNIPIVLAGNFGECRPNHFHSGLDIKTNAKENLPVHAAAEGYISRIKMEPGGFGHALYVAHPAGYTTVYAHLNDFMPAVQRYVRQQQYKKENWELDITLPPDMFPVKKGQQIAWSGNTGSSTAPHLHFELRDTKTEHLLNPQLFGFEIEDTRQPVPQKLVIYDMGRSVYEQQPAILNLKQKGNGYSINGDTLNANTAYAGIGVFVNDYMNNSHNTLNFYTAQVFMDDELQTEITLDDIGYDVTRYLHAYADYRLKKQTGDWVQCFFKLEGNRLKTIYTYLNDNAGALDISDGQVHKILVKLTDNSGNVTDIDFWLKFSGELEQTSCPLEFVANRENSFKDPNVSVYLKENALYDDICFYLGTEPKPDAYSAMYKVHRAEIPIHSYYNLNIKPNKPVPFEYRDKIAAIYTDGKGEDGKAAKYDDKGWYSVSVRNFGNYWLEADTIPPVIKPLQNEGNLASARQLRFSVKEAKTSVKKFRAEVNGKWLCFEKRGDIYFYEFDEHCPKGENTLVVTAEDENGNKAKTVFNFTR